MLVGIVAPLVLPAYFELAGGLVLAALLLLWQVRGAHIVFGVLAVAAVLATIGCAVWSVREFYDGHDRRQRATSTACCGCRSSARARRTIAAR